MIEISELIEELECIAEEEDGEPGELELVNKALQVIHHLQEQIKILSSLKPKT